MTEPMAAPVENSVYKLAVCRHCGRDIVFMAGDIVWLHDKTGWQRCDGQSDPAPGEQAIARLSIVRMQQ